MIVLLLDVDHTQDAARIQMCAHLGPAPCAALQTNQTQQRNKQNDMQCDCGWLAANFAAYLSGALPVHVQAGRVVFHVRVAVHDQSLASTLAHGHVH